MKVGITLPQFEEDVEACLAVARRAEAARLDGVFAFDHLWPIRRPDRPALHGTSLLAALAVETEAVAVGTLVARVGLLPGEVLARTFATLQGMAGPRLVAGLGIGDALSRDENRAYGVPFRPAAERRAALAACCRRLRAMGIVTWVGGLSSATRAVGRADADGLNLWGVEPEAVAAEATSLGGTGVEVTWGGRVDLAGDRDLPDLLASLSRAGAAWAVVAPVGAPWDAAVEVVAGAATALP